MWLCVHSLSIRVYMCSGGKVDNRPMRQSSESLKATSIQMYNSTITCVLVLCCKRNSAYLTCAARLSHFNSWQLAS